MNKNNEKEDKEVIDENKLLDDELLLASDKPENIRIGKWYNGKLSLNKMLTKKYDKERKKKSK